MDVVINSVGIGAQGTIEANPYDEWRRVFDVNVLGTVRVSHAALPYLRRSPAASIVNIGSVAAAIGIPERALYSATKGGVQALTRAMAADHLGEGSASTVSIRGPRTLHGSTAFCRRLRIRGLNGMRFK